MVRVGTLLPGAVGVWLFFRGGGGSSTAIQLWTFAAQTAVAPKLAFACCRVLSSPTRAISQG